MTSTKSSVNHTATYDFRRCLRENALIPMAVAVMASYFLWVFATVINGAAIKEFEWTIFSDYSGYSPTMFNMMYLLCGAFTAVKTFYFLTSTKRCNVYLSMGIDRKTLLKNRMISSIIWMSISCVIPLAVSLLANYLNFSITSETIKTAIYLSLCFFLNMLLGYGIAGSIMLSVGNVIEGIGIYAIIIMIPSTLNLAVNKLGNYMFNGISVVNVGDIFGIEGYMPPLKSYIDYFIPFEFVDKIRTNQKIEVDFTGISALNWLTLICWLAVAILVISIMPLLMKKRKAEISGAFGADRRLVVIASGVVAFLMFTLWCGFDLDNLILKYALMIIMPVIGYFFTVALIYRIDRDIKNNIAGVGVTAVVSVILTVCSMTNCFGYFNKLPAADEVEYAALMPSVCVIFDKSSERTLTLNSSLHGKITDIEDINKIISIQERAVKGLGKGEARVAVVYKLKNGKTIARAYRNVSDEGAKASMEFIETKYYKKRVNDVLSLAEFDEDKEREKLSVKFDKTKNRVDSAEYMFDANLFENKADYTNSVPSIFNSDLSDKFSLDTVMSKDEILTFKKALATDLNNMTVEQTFYPQEKPLYFVHFYRYDYIDNDSYENDNFPVYSFMTNTLNILNRYSNELQKLKCYTIDDIEVVQMKKVQDAIKVYDSWDKQIYFTLDRTVCATYVSPEFYGDTSVEGIVYRSSDFDNATEVTDKATIERYFNNYRSQHSFIGDDGAFVQFMFKDGGDLIAYIPEKFV